MASIAAALDAKEDEGIVENAARIGREVLAPGRAELQAGHPITGEGVFWALELVSDRETREPISGQKDQTERSPGRFSGDADKRSGRT